MRLGSSNRLMSSVILFATLVGFVPRAEAQTILIFDENATNMRARDAATRLGLTFTRARVADFDTLLRGSRWDLVVVDLPSSEPAGAWQGALADHITAGGRAIHSQWNILSVMTLPASYQVTVATTHDAVALHRWSSDPLFSSPQTVPDHLTMLTDLWGTNGFFLEPAAGARAAAGSTMMPTANQALIVVGNSGRTIFNGFLFDDYGAFDTDTDGIPDITELLMNEIASLAMIFPTAPCAGMPEGAACTAMPGGAGLCRGGVCCYGCWNGTRCEGGATGSSCGIGGAMCASCADGMQCTLDACEAGTCRNPLAPVGTGCDDSMFCTATDTCNSLGACTGSGARCSDGETCTTDVCEEATDTCSFPPVDTSCTIGGTCVGEGMIHPGNPCLICDPARRIDDWSPLAPDTACGADFCAMGRLRRSACDAAGMCVRGAPILCPTGTCLDATSCEPGCTAGTCAAGEFCDATSMRCMPQLADGAGCGDASECTSGNCVDAVCCATACGGLCERCDTIGSIGACTPLSAGVDPDMECATSCDGAGACQGEPDAGAIDAGARDDGGTVGIDAGPRRDAGGGGGARDDGGCGCSGSSADTPWALLVIAGVLLRRRRRRN
jgi:uncharacterized protein (TIGR03382 family)